MPEREKFQRYARSFLRPTFEAQGWEVKEGEPPTAGNLRASLIAALGNLNDEQVIADCRVRFAKYLADPASLAPDLRPAVFAIVGRYADEKTWNQLHELGLKTTSIEEKQNYYNALACAIDPEVVKKTLPLALTDELPTSRAILLVSKVARESGHPDVAWDFAKANIRALLANTDATLANRYAPGLFTFFSDPSRVDELRAYAKTTLPARSAPEVAKVADEILFRAELKKRLTQQLTAWIGKRNQAMQRTGHRAVVAIPRVPSAVSRPGKAVITSDSMLKKNRSAPNTAVLPVLYYPDVPEAVGWLTKALPFTVRLRNSETRCQLMHSNGAIVVAKPGVHAEAAPSTQQSPAAHSITLRVTAIDELFGRAKAAGARVLAEPEDQMFGERQCSFLDPWGHPWTLSETIFDSDPADWGGELLVE
jgi:uncharacterized glyoxalase superfamily protein PhnB